MYKYEQKKRPFYWEKYFSQTLLCGFFLIVLLVVLKEAAFVQFNLYQHFYYFQETYTFKVLSNFVQLLYSIAPYFIVSVIFSTALIQYFSTKQNSFLTTDKTVPAIFIGAFAGLLSPLPTFVAIPFGLSLKRTGAPLPAIIAFITASPLVNPNIFYLTWSLLGIKIATARILSAFIIAITCGFLTPYLIKSDTMARLEKYLFSPKKRRPFLKELLRHSLFMGKLFLVSIFISSLVKTLVPAEFIATLFNSFSASGLLIAIAMGVPLYNCGGAAIPIIQVLMDMGMSSGAALAFFISGPMTKPATLYIYKSTLGYKFFGIHILIIFMASLLFGLIYSWI
jgi:uncharacterized protein